VAPPIVGVLLPGPAFAGSCEVLHLRTFISDHKVAYVVIDAASGDPLRSPAIAATAPMVKLGRRSGERVSERKKIH
jgi:hypothetical protein